MKNVEINREYLESMACVDYFRNVLSQPKVWIDKKVF
jgi:hypothetical protein